MTRTRWFAHGVAVLAAVCWGGELFLIHYLENPESARPIAPELAGFTGYGLCLIMLALTRGTPVLPKPRGSWRAPEAKKLLLKIGLIGAALNAMAFIGLKLTTSANAAILQRTDILFTLLLSQLFLHERIRSKDWLAIVAMVGGVAAILWAGALEMRAHVVGDSMLLVSALLVSINAIFIQRCQKHTDSGTIATANSFFITLGFLALVGLESAGFAANLETVIAQAWLLLLLGFALALVFVLYYISLGLLPLWEVRILMLLMPVSCALFEHFLLGTQIGLEQAAGMAAIMAGAASISLRGRAKPVLSAEC